ncbi:CsbD family protein [Paraburkholderia acidipaludis]|uniref:CsbD family protein n=1 Tax=Paraburkholderia acidipaludis TaxID=660537 RepID=UPI000482B292|nr:CsbD family protein [Paraburkholderia acidipaludis]
METAKVKGMAQEVAGRAEELAGDALGDTGTHLVGKTRALCGSLQRLAANAASSARETVSGNPLAALGIALGIGMLVGALWSANRE